MRVLERRLRRLEEGLLPPAESEESRRILDAVIEIERRRAAMLGLPAPDDDPEPVYRPGMSIGDTIRAGVHRLREHWAVEEAEARSPARTSRDDWNGSKTACCRPTKSRLYS
jgi:hypothetical protein